MAKSREGKRILHLLFSDLVYMKGRLLFTGALLLAIGLLLGAIFMGNQGEEPAELAEHLGAALFFSLIAIMPVTMGMGREGNLPRRTRHVGQLPLGLRGMVEANMLLHTVMHLLLVLFGTGYGLLAIAFGLEELPLLGVVVAWLLLAIAMLLTHHLYLLADRRWLYWIAFMVLISSFFSVFYKPFMSDGSALAGFQRYASWPWPLLVPAVLMMLHLLLRGILLQRKDLTHSPAVPGLGQEPW